MGILNKAILATITLFLWACQPNTEERSSREESAPIEKVKVPKNNIAPSPSLHPSTCYYHLTGTLGDMKIIAELIEDDNPDEGIGGELNGYYLYEKYGGPIALYGHFDKQGKIELIEQGTWDGEHHKIVGSWDSDGNFKGEWISGNKKNRYPIVLSATGNDFIKLGCREIKDSIEAFPNLPTSPQATFSAHWLEAQSDNKTLNAFLNKSIETKLRSENIPTGKNFFKTQKEAYFNEYKNEISLAIQDGVIDTTGGTAEFYGYSYDQSVSMDVYYNSTEILTLGFMHYQYLGGAHGMYSTNVTSYNLKTFKEIKLQDIFKDGFETAVSEQLANALRIKFELGEDTPLSEILYDDAIMPNENFGVTNKGIFFIYTPYEIAPYSTGEIELFVSFERVMEFVKE